MITFLLLFVVVLTTLAMFAFLNRRINDLQLKLPEVGNFHEIHEIENTIQGVKHKAIAAEKFSNDVLETAHNRIDEIKLIEGELSRNFKEWESIYANSKLLFDGLQAHRENYEHLHRSINLAEEYTINLNNVIQDCTILRDEIKDVYFDSEITFQNLEQGKKSLEQKLIEFNEDIDKNVYEQSENVKNVISCEIDAIKQSELLNLRNDIKNLLDENDGKLNSYTQVIRSEYQSMEHAMDSLLRSYENKIDNITSTLNKDANEIESNFEIQLNTLSEKLNSQMTDVNQKSETIFQTHLSSSQDIHAEISESIESVTQILINKKNEISSYVQFQMDQLKSIGDKSYEEYEKHIQTHGHNLKADLQEIEQALTDKLSVLETVVKDRLVCVEGELDDKVQDFEEKLNHSLHNFQGTVDNRIIGFEGKVEENIQKFEETLVTNVNEYTNNVHNKISELDTYSNSQYETVMKKINELTEVSKIWEKSTREDNLSFQKHIEETHEKLKADYANIALEKNTINSALQSLKLEYDTLEQLIRSQLANIHEEHKNDLESFVGSIKDEVKNKTLIRMEEILKYFEEMEQKNTHEIEKVREEYIQKINKEKREFLEGFEHYKTELNTDVDEYTDQILTKISELESFSDSQYGLVMNKIQELSELSKTWEQRAIEDKDRIQKSIEAHNDKLREDYTSIAQEKDSLHSAIESLKSDYDSLEQHIRVQLEHSHASHKNNLDAFVDTIKEEVKSKTLIRMEEINSYFAEMEKKNTFEIEKIRDEYIQKISDENDGFLENFEHYKTELNTDVNSYRVEIENTKTVLLSDFDSQKADYQNKVNENKELLEELKKDASVEITITKDSIIEDVKNHKMGLNELIENIHKSFEQNVAALYTRLESFSDDIENQLAEKSTSTKNDIEHTTNSLYADFESQKTEYLTQLNESKDLLETLKVDAKIEITHTKEELIKEVNTHKSKISELIEHTNTSFDKNLDSLYAKLADFSEGFDSQLIEKSNSVKDDIEKTKSHIFSEFESQRAEYVNRLNESKELLEEFKVEASSEILRAKEDLIEEAKAHKLEVNKLIEETNHSFGKNLATLQNKLDEFSNEFEVHLAEQSRVAAEDYKLQIQNKNEELSEEIKKLSTEVQLLEDHNVNYQKLIEDEYYNMRTKFEADKNDIEEYMERLKKDKISLQDEINEIYGFSETFETLFTQMEDKIAEIHKEKEDINNNMLEINNFNANISVSKSEFSKIDNELKHTVSQLEIDKQKFLKMSIENKAIMKTLSQINDKLKKSSQQMKVIENQEKNMENIKAMLVEVQEYQSQIGEYKKTLYGWENDYKIFNNNFDTVISKNADILNTARELEDKFKHWNKKIGDMDQTIQMLEGKYNKFSLIQDELDEINKKVPTVVSDIKNNLEEYKEMQSSFVDEESRIKNYLSNAEHTIQTLMTLVKNSNERVAMDAREIDPSSQQVKGSVIDLHRRYGWNENQISQTLGLTESEVKLILQKA